MRTWEEELKSRGIEVMASYDCPVCERRTPAFAIVLDRTWRCTACVVEEERNEHVGHEADWNDVRGERDRQLADTDWTEMPGPRRGMTEAQLARWDALRQRLRDAPSLQTPLEALALLDELRVQSAELRLNNPKE